MERPYIIEKGVRLYSPTQGPQRLPFCDHCNTLAANFAGLYTELPSKWRKWLAYPKFTYQEEAFMGCLFHPVEDQIKFLDGRTERFVSLPPTRWHKLKDPYAVVLAVVFALVFAVLFAFLFK